MSIIKALSSVLLIANLIIGHIVTAASTSASTDTAEASATGSTPDSTTSNSSSTLLRSTNSKISSALIVATTNNSDGSMGNATTPLSEDGPSTIWWVIFLVMFGCNFLIVTFPVFCIDQCRNKKRRLEHEVRKRHRAFRGKKVTLHPINPAERAKSSKTDVDGKDTTRNPAQARPLKKTVSSGKGKLMTGGPATAKAKAPAGRAIAKAKATALASSRPVEAVKAEIPMKK